MQELGADALVIYSILLRDLTLRNTVKFRVSEILDVLEISTTNTRMVLKVKETIEKMNEEVFDIYIDSKCKNKLTNKLDNNTTYYAKLHREQLKNNFFKVYDDEIDKIIEIAKEKKMSKNELLAQFLYFAKSFGGNEKEDNYRVCQMKAETIAKYICTSRSTVLRNNTILEDAGLILVGNAGLRKEDDKYRDTANIYARTEHKDEFNKYLEQQKKTVSIQHNNKKDKENTDIQRRLKQKINNYKKKHDIDNLSLEEWNELNILEREYVDFSLKVRGKEKIKKGTGLVTIKLDGTNKEYYRDNVVSLEEKRKVMSTEEFEDLFGEIEQDDYIEEIL